MSQRYAFVAEWLDPNSGVLWRYQLFYYKDTNELEMFDIKNRRHFLKRIKYDGVTLQQLYIGSTIVVYARQLRLIEYGDDFTRQSIEARAEKTLALIKPDAVKHMGKIINAITTSGFSITNMRMCQLSRADAEAFYAVHAGRPFFNTLCSFMTSGPIVALELMAASSITKWGDLLGPTDSSTARQQAPNSIRGLFGNDGTRNAAHGSDSPANAAAELSFFFGKGSNIGRCARCSGTTLGLIKPHAVKDGLAGMMLDCIQEVFNVTGLQLFALDKPAAAEFVEVYKGVVAPGEFSAMVDELVAGPCIAVEVADREGGEAVEPFRQLCGPLDPELGRVLRPHSLRARFGVSRVRNGIHCTDLQEDGQLETSYFFRILQAA
ncbi:hypothetical protein OEZ85_011667 [Tetradesmus obliquus]|uniref:Nucleoside diphosphate kinase n=1 Tax=Tetradesmus obliquus TaxID=3088 RepID=A0ABY8TT58_TETOB|nr:hypothetical protein OEZ85_011667 [Tetradesmus obliquus]